MDPKIIKIKWDEHYTNSRTETYHTGSQEKFFRVCKEDIYNEDGRKDKKRKLLKLLYIQSRRVI